MTLDAHEFIRRFLLHTLPDGFHRIRHYGFLANGHRAAKLELCSQAAGRSVAGGCRNQAVECDAAAAISATRRCPCCGGQMVTLAIWRCGQAPRRPFWNDSS